MYVELPAQIAVDSFLQDVHHIGANHGHVVFEAVLADVFHELLQVVHLSDSDATIHAVGIVRQAAFAQIALDAAQRVIGRNAEESEVAFRAFGVDGAEGVDFAECAAKYAQGTEFEVASGKALREVAAVGADAFVAVVGEVVVPVAQG